MAMRNDPYADPYAVSGLVNDPYAEEDVYGAPRPEDAVTRPRDPSLPPEQTTAPAGMPQGGQWGANFEWTAAEGGPKVNDIQIGNVDWLTGYNHGAWGTGARGSESLKNAAGRFFSQVDPRQPGALQAVFNLPGFRDFFPNAKIVAGPKGDLIDFGDGKSVDVLRNAVEGGAGDAWQFLVPGAGGAPPPAGATMPGMPGGSTGQIPGQRSPLVDPVTGGQISDEAYRRLVAAGWIDPRTGQATDLYNRRSSRVRDLVVNERDPMERYGPNAGGDLRTLI